MDGCMNGITKHEHFVATQTSYYWPSNICVLTRRRFCLLIELCFTPVMALQLSLDKAACVSLWDEKEIVHRESLADEERGKDRASLWRAVRGFPPGTKRQLVKHDMEPAQRLRYATDLQPARVDGGSCFLQFKENRNLVLYPELRVEKKVKKGQKNLWPADAQEWIVAKVSEMRQALISSWAP